MTNETHDWPKGDYGIEQQSTALAKAQARIAELEGALVGALKQAEELASEDRSAWGHLRAGLADDLRRARAALKGEG